MLGDPRKARAVVGVIESLRQASGEICDLCAEDGDETAVEQCAEDLLEMIRRRRRRAGDLEPGVLSQHRAVQLLELATRLDAELVDKQPAPRLVGLQRFGLPAGTVEREHVLAAQSLPYGIFLDKDFELTDELPVATHLQIRLHALLESRKPELLEVYDVRLRE